MFFAKSLQPLRYAERKNETKRVALSTFDANDSTRFAIQSITQLRSCANPTHK